MLGFTPLSTTPLASNPYFSDPPAVVPEPEPIPTGAGRSKRKFQVETERGVIEVDSLDDVAELVRIAKAKREKAVQVKLEGMKVATPSTKPNIDYKAIEAKLRASIQAEMDDEDDILMLLL